MTSTQRSPYRGWLASDGIEPAVGHFVSDLHRVAVGPWARFDCRAAVLNHSETDRSTDCWVLELGPGESTTPVHHLFELLLYAISGEGQATVTGVGGRSGVCEWRTGTLWAVPLNCTYTVTNTGSRAARVVAVSDAAPIVNIFRDPAFVFGSGHDFADRFDGSADYFEERHEAEGRFVTTNVAHGVADYPLFDYAHRGAGGRNVKFTMGYGTLRAHLSEFPVGTYKKAHRHDAGAHVFILGGEGYSLFWREGEAPRRHDWRPGSLLVPPGGYFHQHFNLGSGPARYLALSNMPMRVRDGVQLSGLSTRLGGGQIEYEDEDPAVIETYRSELSRRGIADRMADFRAVG